MNHRISRRQFIVASGAALATSSAKAVAGDGSPVIDIHQHTRYHGRSDKQLISHQRAMGVTHTILLPSGSYVNRPSTHDGRSNGLAANCTGNKEVYELAQKYPDELHFMANEVPDLPEARKTIEKYLKLGAIGIGEQKFNLQIDSKPMLLIYDIARDFDVPVLMHIQHRRYNLGFERMSRILEKYPSVKFIGHAQTWWGNIDLDHDQETMYPTNKVTPGGLTDRLLANYPNIYADHSAGSGLNALTRDEQHSKEFLKRHQNQLLYGSDCADEIGRGPGCQGAQTLKTLRRLAPDEKALRKILYENSKALFRL